MENTCLLFIVLGLIVFQAAYCSVSNILRQKEIIKAAVASGANLRLFHPAFPFKIKDPLTLEDAIHIMDVKDRLGLSEDMPQAPHSETAIQLSALPWKMFPELGLSNAKSVLSNYEINDLWERSRHKGSIVWAHKTKQLKAGCILLNHWKQEAILLTDYHPEKGARGTEFGPIGGGEGREITWDPISLEIELMERKWQPIKASSNIVSGEIFDLIPRKMSSGPWEFLFLLLVSPAEHAGEIYQTLFDTGLAPKQGLFAYIRLLDQILLRSEALEGIPTYRKIFESELTF